MINDDLTPSPDPTPSGPELPSSTPDASAPGGGRPTEEVPPSGSWSWGAQPWSGEHAWVPPGGSAPAYGWPADPHAGPSPYGPPPPPYAAYPSTSTSHPSSPPSKPARMAPLAIAVGLAIALVSGVTGAGIGIALRQPASTSTPSTGSSSPSSNQSSSNGTGGLDASAIAAKIDPSVVDVVNTLAGNGGVAEGTGIIISSSGEILTNNHVIDGAASVTVQIDGQGPKLAATVLGYDAVDDVALIKIDNTSGLSLTVAPLGDSNGVSVGDAVVALGNAEGQGGTPAVATGTVTALDQSITASDGGTSENLTGVIEMNANIVPGDSGGPLVNAAGKVIGIDTAGAQSGFSYNGTSATQGFAIPINTAYQIAQQIASGHSSGSIEVGPGPFIGVSVGQGSGLGAPVVGVEPNTPAAAAGLQAGDYIVSFNGTTITNSGDLSTALETLRPGQTVQLGWVDGSGQRHTASITLGSGPPR